MTKIILCADDSVTMQQVAEVTFKGTDYTYVGARSADEALTKAKQQKPALVLADAVMPGKTGYELCQALKADGFADVPVVILCGNSQAYDPARGAQVGADGTLSKPWDTQVMLDKIAEFLEKGATGKAAPAAAAAAPAAAKPATPPAVAPAMAGQRSATIMGMPSIKLPPQMGAAPVAATPAPVAKAAEPSVPSVKPMTSPNIVQRSQPPTSPPPSNVAAAAAAPMPRAVAGDAPPRAPLVSGIPTKRSALVERTLARMAQRLAELSGLEPGSPELLALLKLSTEVVERIVWEVVPDLAEQIIRENLQELAAARRN